MINMGYFLLRSKSSYPDKTALICEGRRITYHELNKRAAKLANGMLKLGVKKGDRVAYLLPNCIEIVETYFAIIKIGAVAVPLNHRLIYSETLKLLKASQSTAFIYSGEYRDVFEASETEAVQFPICITDNTIFHETSYEMLINESSDTEPEISVSGSDYCRLQYTGGTTGIPKGVLHTHEQDYLTMLSLLSQTKIGTLPNEVIMGQSPINHHGGYTWVMCSVAAACTYIMQNKFNAENILSTIEKEKVTYTLLLPPASYVRLISDENFSKYDVSSVKVVQSSAGGSAKEIYEMILKAFPNCEIHYGWGQTESGVGTKLIITRDMDLNQEKIKSIGVQAALIEMKIVDENGNEMPDGAEGECIVRGPTVMSGYYNNEEKTREVLKDGWLHTEDIMKRDKDGYLYMCGRKKDMIKTGGENVFAFEVEYVLKSCPGVEECIVVGVPDAKWGEAITAVIKPKNGCSLSQDIIMEHCSKNMAGYKKPKYIKIVEEDLADSAGKVNKHKIYSKYNLDNINKN